MSFAKKRPNDKRDLPVPRADFQCSCGCELQLTRGDLADAIRSSMVFGGAPRSWGVTYTTFNPPREGSRAADEPVERHLCTGCRYNMVEIFTYAAQLLRERGAPFPRCEKCRT